MVERLSLVDFLEPCLRCEGTGQACEGRTPEHTHHPCPSCVRGRVVSEFVIEEMAEAIYHAGIPDHPDPDDIRYLAEAAGRVVLEHMEDNERKTG